MRSLLWLLLAVGVVANVFVTTFSGYSGVTQALASAGTGAVFIGSGIGLWLTRPRSEGGA
ncbi:hypothetical protein VO63_28120 [Streptomyces showdoensis]|uniref:Uncharacterized protein n=2 Tax=Streptomyces showdoensis TaxID=68268 RepID=A0A2P2GGE3_STREW|nr:hypothetical protein VO63_28120 [Streptomyces showdoensis]